jgi:hypothetical protein
MPRWLGFIFLTIQLVEARSLADVIPKTRPPYVKYLYALGLP